MANKNYKLTFALSDGTSKSVTFTAPQGPQGLKGDTGEQGPRGEKGEKGDAFSISKVYESVSAMQSGYSTDGVPSGGFVVIDTGSVEDEDNAKLYYKGASAYVYLTDMSGATGLQGPQGVKGEKGDTGATGAKGADGTSVTVKSVSESATDGGSNVITFSDGKTITIKNGSKGSTGATGAAGAKGDTGAKGDKGDTGVGITSVAIEEV